MKKGLAIFLSFVLLLSTSGIMLVTHYCGIKETTYLVVGLIDKEVCGCKKHVNKCCKNEVKVLKIDSKFNTQIQAKIVANPYFSFLLPTSSHPAISNDNTILFHQVFIDDPPFPAQSRIILFHSFLI